LDVVSFSQSVQVAHLAPEALRELGGVQAWMIESWGWRPRYQLAKRTLVYVLFAEPGGMKIIKRSISPRPTCCRNAHNSAWCLAGFSWPNSSSLPQYTTNCSACSASAIQWLRQETDRMTQAVENDLANDFRKVPLVQKEMRTDVALGRRPKVADDND
jgi:hypothetical protein